MKRLILLACVLVGCPSSSSSQSCNTDADCGSDVCARDGECLAASDVWMVKVSWTIRGMAANASTCSNSPDLYLQFDGPTVDDTFGYAPVPCQQGQFSIDKLPKRFEQVEIGVDGQLNNVTIIDPSTGTASFDLFP